MATTPDLHEPQIAAARAQAWHQTGDALLTLEAARQWLGQYGLVLFSPVAGALGAPAPSLVEATLGMALPNATLEETATARTLTARLVGEGSALPLNLLGGPGDLPDFLVTAQAFPFVFTLRGDKGWKRPPETTGTNKVTPLALRVYELLAERGALPIAEIVPEIGREVTESAIARALNELWQMLRVVPVLQQGEGDTLWELTTTRFLKTVKAGANAGQPTALSALASLYLMQAFVASEEEIAGFLSPLTARSRVRDVLHGLTAGRQLTEGVVNGKTVLYVPESLPDFAQFAATAEGDTEEMQGDAEETGESASAGDSQAETAPDGAPRERIRRFEGSDEGRDRKLRGKPVQRREPTGRRPERGERPAREGARGGPRRDREASGTGEGRPFAPRGERPGRREGGDGRAPRVSSQDRRPSEGRPAFNRPWDENKGSRPPRRQEEGEGRPGSASGEGRPARPFQSRAEGGDRPARPYRPRTEGEDRPARPYRPRTEGEDRPKRPYRPRTEEGDRPARPYRQRSEGEDRPKRPYRPRTEEGDRPARPYRSRAGGEDRPQRPFRPRAEEGERPQRPFRPREEGSGRPRPAGGGDRPFRPREGREPGQGEFRPRNFGAPRGGDRPSPGRFGEGRPSRFPGGDREGGEGGERRPPRRPSFGGRPGGGGPSRGPRPQGGSGERREFRPGGAGGGGRPGFKKAGFKKAGAKFAGRGGSSARPADRPSRPDRPARRPRPEDEA